jgi:hypothetical protein
MQAFGDSFDLYNATADMTLSYWDAGTGNASLQAVGSGRFTGSRCISSGSGGGLSLVKSSGQNDAIHHIVCSYKTADSLTGAAIGFNFQLQDAGTTQCSVCFRSDGAIVLQSGTPGGTTLATYTTAVTANNTWFAFEIEVVINNATGSMTVRKNGNTSNDFTLGSLNTRGGTANNYANRIAISGQNAVNQLLDDVLWRSDPTSVPWVGDIRCYPRMPNANVSVQFSSGPYTWTFGGTNTYNSRAASSIHFHPFVVPASLVNPVTSVAAAWFGSTTGGVHVNMAIYDNTGAGGSPGNLVAATTQVLSPSNPQTFTFPSPPTLTVGGTYWIAQNSDGALNWSATTGAGSVGYSLAYTYAAGAFPSTAAGAASYASNEPIWLQITAGAQNWFLVSEPQQDALTSYIYDNTVGHLYHAYKYNLRHY